MGTRTTLDMDADLIPEGTTPIFRFTIQDSDGAAFTPDVLRGTLYDVKSGTVINGRSDVDLLPYVVSGEFEWRMASGDTQILQDKKDAEERHRLLLRWAWDAQTKVGAHEIDHIVVNFQKVP